MKPVYKCLLFFWGLSACTLCYCQYITLHGLTHEVFDYIST